MRLDPKDRFSYANLSDAYESLGRYDEARAILDQAAAQRAESHHLMPVFALHDGVPRGDKAGMQRAMDRPKGSLV